MGREGVDAELEPRTDEPGLIRLVGQLPASIAMVDGQMRYLAASERYLREHRIRDVIGRSHYSVFPETPERWKQMHRRCLAGAVESCEEDRFERAGGSTQWLRWEVRPWRDASGRIGGLLIYSEDISERVQARESLTATSSELTRELDSTLQLHRLARLSLTRIRLPDLLLEIVDTAIAITGADFGCVQLANMDETTLHTAAMRGLSNAWLEFWNRRAQGSGSCGAALRSRGRLVIENVESSPVLAGSPELPLLLDAGVRSLQLTPLLSRSGGALGIFSTFYRVPRQPAEKDMRHLDLLARQAADSIEHAQYSAQQKRFGAILDSTSDAVVAIDSAGKILSFNRSATRLFGYPAQDVLGQDLSLLLPPEERSPHEHAIQRYRENGVQHIIGKTRTVSAWRRDGSRCPVEVTISEVDHLGIFVGCMRDLTNTRRLEEEVVQIAMLEQRRIGQELHDDVQQDLTGLGLLTRTLADRLGRESLEEQSALAGRIATGIATVGLTVRRLAHGLLPVPLGSGDLPAALAELAQKVTRDYGLQCDFDYPEPLSIPEGVAATHLYRIAQEAVGNAVRHAQAQRIWLRLVRSNGTISMEVADDGVGVTAKRKNYMGAGMRLMEHRCSLIGGSLRIDERAGGGTIVCCALPSREPA